LVTVLKCGSFCFHELARTYPVMALKRLPGRMGRAPSRVAALPKKAESFYQSAEWRAYRSAHKAETVRRQGGVWCAVCGSRHKLVLDHVVERRDGGPDFPAHDGAKWYCSGCHNAKTARARMARVVAGVGGSEGRGGGRKSGGSSGP